MIRVNMRQWTILTYIQWYCEEHGRAPSLSEVKRGCGIGHHPTISALANLIAVGVVRQEKRHNSCLCSLAMRGQKVIVTP